MKFGPQMEAVHPIAAIYIFAFSLSPYVEGIDDLPNSYFVTGNGINTGRLKLCKKFYSFPPCRCRPNAFAVPTDSFPVPLALCISIPENVDSILLACAHVSLGRHAIIDTLELGFDIFSALFVAHGIRVATNYQEGKLFIQNLSESNF